MPRKPPSVNVVQYLCGISRGLKATNVDSTLFFILNAAAVIQHEGSSFTTAEISRRLHMSYNTALHYIQTHTDLFARTRIPPMPNPGNTRYHYRLTDQATQILNTIFAHGKTNLQSNP